jgi:hypothetical protein
VPPYRIWDRLRATRWLLEPKVFELQLALPACEAHSEPIISALIKMASPSGYCICEKTILARPAAHGRARRAYAPSILPRIGENGKERRAGSWPVKFSRSRHGADMMPLPKAPASPGVRLMPNRMFALPEVAHDTHFRHHLLGGAIR